MSQPSRVNQLSITVIAKECLPGNVKTRLTPPLEPAQGAALAQSSLSQTLRTVRKLPAQQRLLIFYGTPTSVDREGFTVVPQGSGGLDARLAAICSAVTGPLLIVGMDTPQLDAAALQPLLSDWSGDSAEYDAWFGPADDGGFWALALATPDPELILGVPMSSADTGRVQLARLEAAGLTVGTLPALRDVDYFNDAQYVASQCPGSEFANYVEALNVEMANSQGVNR